ncbi:MAG: hypothetical protein ACHRXM_03410 [Isosphaerales bacterium]
MTQAQSPTPPTWRTPSWAQLRIWHLALLVLFVAIAIADIQDQRIREPVLIALAAGGLVLYGLIGWIGWWVVRRFEARLGPILLFTLYSVAMGVLFLVATVIYLITAHVYRGGRL